MCYILIIYNQFQLAQNSTCAGPIGKSILRKSESVLYFLFLPVNFFKEIYFINCFHVGKQLI
jgi:hypothetical protein